MEGTLRSIGGAGASSYTGRSWGPAGSRRLTGGVRSGDHCDGGSLVIGLDQQLGHIDGDTCCD